MIVSRLALLALALLPFSSAAEPLRLGTAWYPEQWPEDRWEADLALMEQAHLDVVRIGEFAWSRMEPKEGHYDFAWLDAAIAAAERHHIAVVLCTPTAAPPAWLTSHYPDTLAVDEDGVPAEHGMRQHFSFASSRYRRFARDISLHLAERYGHDQRVIGWQIDNELAVPSFDPEARSRFHAWLKAKYGSIAALNAHWTTAYWSQSYDSFDQVPMHQHRNENPGLLLDLQRFLSDTWIDYLENQRQALRAHSAARQFITTNSMGWPVDGLFDEYDLHRQLDIAAWDEYMPEGHYDWLAQALQHDRVRGYKQRNFWVMETQPAFVNWKPINAALAPGQTREVAWQAVAHGADAVLYWQWRSALNGQEQYHGTLVGADGTPVPAYDEIARTGAEFARAGAALDGTTPAAEVAVIYDYPSQWAIDFQRHHKDFDPVALVGAFYRPLETGAQAVDLVSAQAELGRYRLVVAPDLNVLTEAEAQNLRAYVEAGGHLVLGPRSGMKDGFNALNPERQPGPLAAMLGARVEQFYALDQPVAVAGAPGSGTASIWAESLETQAPDAQVLLRYAQPGGWLDGKPAAVTRAVGRGSVTYLGAWLDPALLQVLTQSWLDAAGIKPILVGLPPDVELGERQAPDRRVLVLINHGAEPRRITLPGPMQDVLAGRDVAASVTLAPHDLGVFAARIARDGR